MINKGLIIKICKVISISDENDGERIKVKINPEDNNKNIDDIPYAYPLLPKMIHIKPKVGEAVLIILTEADNGNSNRYYIGPIISQPQYMDMNYFGIESLSLYPDNQMKPDIAPSTNPESNGALASDDDIAIYGRKKNDIILTDDDIRIRCGSRLKDSSVDGGIVFNRLNPSYIHLKHSDYERGKENDTYKSTATIVADKINLIGNQSVLPFKTTDKEHLINDGEMQKIIETAYRLPYGDVLVDFLKLFVNTFLTHSHPYPGETPCETDEYKKLRDYPIDSMLSESVRIN